MQFLKFMEDDNESKYPQFNAIIYLLSILVKVLGTNNFRFAYGLNLFLGSPLEAKPEF